MITEKIDYVLRSVVVQTVGGGFVGKQANDNNLSIGDHNITMEAVTGYTLWSYGGKFWHVPEDFALPARTKRKRAWELWVSGMELENGKKIRPFRFIKPRFIPKKHWVKFKTEWQPIMKKMEKAPRLVLPEIECYDALNSSIIERTYTVAMDHLKTDFCSFLWQDKKNLIENWSVASWLSYTQMNYIKKYGNANEMANLPEETRYNAPHKMRRKMKRKVTEISLTEVTQITEV